MKKRFYLTIAIFTCFMSCLLNTMVVDAATTEEVTAEEKKNQWYDTGYYPLHQGIEEWQYNYPDVLDILNPPPDLLLSMPTEELADLMQEYPLMWQMMTYFGPDGQQSYTTFFAFMEDHCDIFYELLRREDGISCLLEEYRTNEYIWKRKNNEFSYDEIDQMFLAEIFGCQFIRYYSHHFTDNEYQLASQIIEEKKELYSITTDDLYYLDLPEIEPPSGEEVSSIRTNHLSPEEIEEKEDKFATALLQMESTEKSLPTLTPDTEDSNITKPEDDIESIAAEADNNTATEPAENEIQQKVMILVGAIIVLVGVIGGFLLIRRRKKE